MEVGQGTAQELVAEEERNRRNIDSFVQEPHRKGVPEAVEGDMLADTCSRDELGVSIRRSAYCSLALAGLPLQKIEIS